MDDDQIMLYIADNIDAIDALWAMSEHYAEYIDYMQFKPNDAVIAFDSNLESFQSLEECKNKFNELFGSMMTSYRNYMACSKKYNIITASSN